MTAIEDDFLRRLDRAPLDANSVADRHQAFRAREELLNKQHQRLQAAVERGTSGETLKGLVAALNEEFRSFLNEFSWEDRKELNRFPEGYPTPWLVGELHYDQEDLAAAGGRSPAAVYRDAPDTALDGLSEPARKVVSALIDSDMTVQPLRILDDPRGYGPLGSRSIEGPFDAEPARDAHARQAARHWSQQGRHVLRAVGLAAHYSGSRALAIPVTETARAAAHSQRYAHHVADDHRGAIDKLTTGQWRSPPGALIVVDDADELAPDDLRQLTALAGRTNTKLLLVSADRAGLGPDDPLNHARALDSWNRESRYNTDTLQHHLPWSQHLGDPQDHQLCATAADEATRLRRYLSALDVFPDDIGHKHAAALLDRHDTLVAVYTELAAPFRALQANRGPHLDREQGLSL